ncbi:MAG: 2-phospho-L-lactate transferase [Actinomycetales bacterium]
MTPDDLTWRPERVVVLAGGIGGARFLLGLRACLPEADITVIGNTGDDIWVHGVRVCPDLDTVMYTLGGGISTERGWGREAETFVVKEELAAYGAEPTWFGLGDRDLATHLIRTASLQAGYPLSAVTEALCRRWQPGVRLLPMSDDRAETHVIVDDPEGGLDASGQPLRIAIHFQQWWIQHRAALAAHGFRIIGIDQATPAPGVLQAIAEADLICFPPSNPVVSIGVILAVPGISDAVRAATAPVVGLSPIIGSAPVRGMADACLTAIGLPTSALAVATHYGARRSGGVIDGWLVETSDAAMLPELHTAGIRARAVPLMMTDVSATAAMAAEAIDLAGEIAGQQVSGSANIGSANSEPG